MDRMQNTNPQPSTTFNPQNAPNLQNPPIAQNVCQGWFPP